MAPIRRYLRITKYSVLECRIYLDNPALAHSWLLNPRDPVLPKVIESVRPLVLPKLREERERSRKKSTKKRGIKDVVAKDDFEVSIFLTETSNRHSLLYKHKRFRDTTQTKLTSNSTKLTGASREAPIDVEEQAQAAAETPVHVLLEEDDDEVVAVALRDIPTVNEDETATAANAALPETRPTKRRRGRGGTIERHDEDYGDHDNDNDNAQVQNLGEDDDELFVNSEEDSSSSDDETAPPPAKRRKDAASDAEPEDPDQRDHKKKLAMDISYEGFSIYGRVLCLVVRRREGSAGNKGKNTSASAARSKTGHSAAPGGQAMMENWITSTQMPGAVADGLLDAS